jgi:L-seryl-tRNA(Ser) seleniumtransferase
MATLASANLRRLPKVDKVLALPQVAALLDRLPRWAVVAAVRAEVSRLRTALQRNVPPDQGADEPEASDAVHPDVERIAQAAENLTAPPLHRVLNATGVVLHTNLGRAPLAAAALQQIADLGAGYLNLEYRLSEGRRGSRQDHLPDLLSGLTGAEAHLVVNNNAAAVLLMLAGLCAEGEVIVSRGELVEIGGSFRVPDVMRASGARLREVGTTNRTHLRDYQGAIGPGTRALLKVHRSNFALVGFTADVALRDLADCAHAAALPCLFDLGSGLLSGEESPWVDLQVSDEPSVKSALAAGCDLVTFSTDKLLGGPQAGVLAGRRDLIDKLRSHPLLRALRPDKLTLIALSATLALYRDGRQSEIPSLAMLATPPAVLWARAERLRSLLIAGLPSDGEDLRFDLIPTRSAVGGGALPLVQPESVAVSPGCSPAQSRELARRLRLGQPALITRLHGGRLLCDVRTLPDATLPTVAAALLQALHMPSAATEAIQSSTGPAATDPAATDEDSDLATEDP